jgi:hypothetical protein
LNAKDNGEKTYRCILDCTYFSCPKLFHQLGIFRVYSDTLEDFFTTCYVLMSNKRADTYKTLFKIVKKNIEDLKVFERRLYTEKLPV